MNFIMIAPDTTIIAAGPASVHQALGRLVGGAFYSDASLALANVFHGGTTSFTYHDINGSPISFPTTASFKNFYAAYGTQLHKEVTEWHKQRQFMLLGE